LRGAGVNGDVVLAWQPGLLQALETVNPAV